MEIGLKKNTGNWFAEKRSKKESITKSNNVRFTTDDVTNCVLWKNNH